MWIRGKESTQNYLLKFINTKCDVNPHTIMPPVAYLTLISTYLWILYSGKMLYQKTKAWC